MGWNWQHPDWPRFAWSAEALAEPERRFAEGAGIAIGIRRHLDRAEQDSLAVALLSGEALDTSAIEGEMLDRESVQSSIRRQLGLAVDRRIVGAAEAGIAEMMVALFRSFAAPLSHETLFAWHRMVSNGRSDLQAVGAYRLHAEPMQIVSGSHGRERVHFEAPPSADVPREMERLLSWIAATAPDGRQPLPPLAREGPLGPLARAGIAHLWFESIHPFEDGNGRIGRAIAERLLVEGQASPMLTGIAGAMLAERKAYYGALEAASRDVEITGWLTWFAATALTAQRRSLLLVEFTLHKAQLLSRLAGHLNPRQEKALLRLFAAGPDGFAEGLSAGKYQSITGATPATATRDLAELVSLGALTRSGVRKGTRYSINTEGIKK